MVMPAHQIHDDDDDDDNDCLKVSHCLKMPPELREQQNNQLGKTFMPYAQSNYR